MKDRFEKVANLDEVPRGGCHALRAGGCPIAVFRSADDRLYAIENRCPHEGYPLSPSPVEDGVLTCEWHNWKFELGTGNCIIGGEDVRTFPLEVRNGEVWLDVSPPADEAIVRAEHKSLEKAIDEGDFSHGARAIERLLQAGESPASVLAFAVRWGAKHTKYGFDHGLATAADLAWAAEQWPEEADQFLADGLELIVRPNLRLPERAISDRSERGDEATLRGAIESESLEDVEAMIRAACVDEAGARDALDWLRRAASDHFLSYGHAMIYSVKTEELLESIGFENAEDVLLSLAARIVYGTREDRLPYMRAFTKRAAPIFETLPTLFERRADEDFDVDGLVHATLDGSLDDSLGAVTAALEGGADPAKVALALALASSHRLLRYDRSFDTDPAAQEGWLDATHTLTHADAVHQALVRHPHPDELRGLFHSARFVHHLGPLDGPADPKVPQRALDEALRSNDAAAAVAAANAAGQAGAPAILEAGYAGRAVLPIFFAHHVKTSRAAVRLAEALAVAFPDRADTHLPLVAAARFLASPLGERRIRRQVLTARTFVREGRMPHRRLGY